MTVNWNVVLTEMLTEEYRLLNKAFCNLGDKVSIMEVGCAHESISDKDISSHSYAIALIKGLLKEYCGEDVIC